MWKTSIWKMDPDSGACNCWCASNDDSEIWSPHFETASGELLRNPEKHTRLKAYGVYQGMEHFHLLLRFLRESKTCRSRLARSEPLRSSTQAGVGATGRHWLDNDNDNDNETNNNNNNNIMKQMLIQILTLILIQILTLILTTGLGMARPAAVLGGPALHSRRRSCFI